MLRGGEFSKCYKSGSSDYKTVLWFDNPFYLDY